jgi:transcriptional repressor of cell division inhibition gene dicB
MRKEEAINYYGSQSALARALGIAQASVAGWRGDYPPPKRQLQLQTITRGKLKAEPGCREQLLGVVEKVGR